MRTRPRSSVAATFAMVFVLLSAAGCDLDPPGRYLNEVFDSVSIEPDLVYGEAPDENGETEVLLLDVYQPEGDVAEGLRPAIVWVHGGFFSFGTKNDADQVALATTFAKRGYVTVSINYRLRFEDVGLAMVDAQHDAQAAVRWLRLHAAEYRIDTDRLAIGGFSAGGITAIAVGNHSEDPGSSGNPGLSSEVHATMAIAGFGGHYSTGDPPTVLFHGTVDDTVPYQLAVDTCDATRRVQNVCELNPYDGAGHDVYFHNQQDIHMLTAAFLFRSLRLGG